MNAEQKCSWRRAAGRSAVVLAAIAALGACAVTSEVFVRSDGSGNMSADVSYSRALMALAQEMAGLEGDGDLQSDALHHRLSEVPGVTVHRAVSFQEPRLEVAVRFEDAPELLPGIISFTRVEEGTRARLYLNADEAWRLVQVFPVLNHPGIRAIGPVENAQTTREDYLSMMGMILGSDGAQSLADSTIVVRIDVDGALVSQRGGRMEAGAVVFEIPVLDALLLHEPIDLEVVFR